MMSGYESVGIIPIEFSSKSSGLDCRSSDNVMGSRTQQKRKMLDGTSPQLLKYRKVSDWASPFSFTAADACHSEVVANYCCTGVDIKKYLKITKSRSKSYKLNSSDGPLETQEVKSTPIVFRKITDYFKGSSSLKTLRKTPNDAVVAFDSFVTPPNPVDDAIQKSTIDPCLIGDFSQTHSLPTVKGKHPDIPSVSPETVARILDGKYEGSFILLDCRYPYEFEGGHIIGARNFYTKSEMAKKLFSSSLNQYRNSRTILIFHCEFSSERGPNMYRFVRNRDRELNAESYPSLYFPEMYILEGGYCAFYAKYNKRYCDPVEYRMMRDQNYTQEMINCRAKCKADKGNNCRKSFRDRVKPRLLF